MKEKHNELEEEAEKGIPVQSLVNAGAKVSNYADCLFLNGKFYEPTAWKKSYKFDGMIGFDEKVPTHYRERGKQIVDGSLPK